MTLLAGSALDPNKFFQTGTPKVQGSSFDLSIGKIYDIDGHEVNGPFILKPNQMVQVVSDEVFQRSDRHTGHVTYKTDMTRQGIWALTVGIVDPGWDGPIATTLLNFSQVPHAISRGDRFLRVSVFKHDQVPDKLLRKSDLLPDYLKKIQSLAATRFPPTFLNREGLAEDAKTKVFDRLRSEGIVWRGAIVIVFTIIQFFAPPAAKWIDNWLSPAGVSDLQYQLRSLQERIIELENSAAALKDPPASEPAGDESSIDSAHPSSN